MAILEEREGKEYDHATEGYIEKNAYGKTDTVPVLSEIFDPAPVQYVPQEMDVYSFTRLEFFAAYALQGLLAGRSEKDQRTAPKNAVKFAREMEELIDKAQG